MISFDDACDLLQSGNKTQRKKGLDTVSRLVTKPQVQCRLDTSTDSKSRQLSWSLLLSWVHEAVVNNVAKLGPNDPIVKAKGFTVAYSDVISCGDARGERIRTSDVICSHITDIIIDSNLCRFLGKDYLNILSRHILPSPHHCANVTQSKWMKFLNQLINVWSKNTALIPASLMINTVYRLLACTSLRHEMQEPVIFTFFTEFIRTEWDKHYEKNTFFITCCMHFGTLYCTQTVQAGYNTHAVLELGAQLIPLIRRPNVLYRGAKGEVMEFVYTVLSVWRVLDPDERSVSLDDVIRSLQDSLLHDLESSSVLFSSANSSCETLFYKLCANVLMCNKDIASQSTEDTEEPAKRRRKVTTFLDQFQGMASKPDFQKISLLKIAVLLVPDGYYEPIDLEYLAAICMNCVRDMKSDRIVTDASLSLLLTILEVFKSPSLEKEVVQVVEHTCMITHQFISLKILSACDKNFDILNFKKPTWANIGFIENNWAGIIVPHKKLVNWLLRGIWKEYNQSSYKITSTDWAGDTSANIGRVLADIVLGNKNCPERGKSCEPDSVSDFKGFLDKYSVLQFKEDTIKHDKTSGEEVIPKLATLNEDVLDNIKSTTMEICMKLSTTGQQDLLLLYCTAVQSLLTQLSSEGVSESQLSSINQQFDFIVVYLRNISLTPELYPLVLEFAKVSTVDVPMSWTTHFLSAIKGNTSESSSLDSDESTTSLWGGKENAVPEDLPSTCIPSTATATQYMANEEAQSLESVSTDPNSERRKQIVEILVVWCRSAPNATVEILNFIQGLVSEYHTEMSWAPCILQILKLLAPLIPTLPIRYVEMLPEIARMMLEKSHKDGMLCSAVLHSVAVMLSHVTLEQHYNAYNSILHNILCNFWNLYEQGKMLQPCREPFLECVAQLVSPRLLSSLNDVISPVDILGSMIRDEVPSVRIQVVTVVTKFLETSQTDKQLQIYTMFSDILDDFSQSEDSSYLSSVTRLYLIFLKSCLIRSPVLQLPALYKIITIAQASTTVSVKAVSCISSSLGYISPRVMFSTFSEQILYRWLLDTRQITEFPASVFSFAHFREFFKEESGAICLSLLVSGDYDQLSSVFTVLDSSPKEVLEPVCTHILGGVLPLIVSSDNSDRACAEKAFEYLYKEVGPKIVTDSLKKDIDKVVGAMVLRLWDPMDGKYAKYMRSDSVKLKHPVYPSITILNCVEYIKKQMKDVKKPGVFKLLQISIGGVQSTLLNVYENYFEAKNDSIRRSVLICYKFLLDMLVEDPHSNMQSSGDWSFVATSVITTITSVLSRYHGNMLQQQEDRQQVDKTNHRNTTLQQPDYLQTAICLDMLSTFLSVLPNAYKLLGASVTELIRILSVLTSSATSSATSFATSSATYSDCVSQAAQIVEMLLNGCTSPEWLPIVTFGNDKLDDVYKKCTSLPLKSKDLLSTVRHVSGAYWYLSTVESRDQIMTSSTDESMIQNSAIHTLLLSHDNTARLLLGRLDHITDLDISLINTIDNPGIRLREWKHISDRQSDEVEYCGIVTDAIKPFFLDPRPEIQRIAYRVARNILRTKTGKVFVKSCYDEDIPIDDILPFTMIGTPDKPPNRANLVPGTELGDVIILKTCSSDLLRYLVPLAARKPSLLDDVLGPVLHDLLTSFPENKPLLSSMFSKDLEKQAHLKHLQACKYLSTKPIDKSKIRHNNFSWLELDWLAMCRGAIRLCQYTTALLYLELYVEGLDETKQLERSQSLCSSADTQDMLLEIYLNLQCSDAIHGTDRNSESAKLKVYAYQHKWYDLINFSDLTHDSRHLLTAVKHTSPCILLPMLLASKDSITEMHYESAWRNSSWDMNPTTEHGVHGNVYSSLLSFRNNARDTALLHLKQAQRESTELNPHDHFINIQLLNEISSLINKESRELRSDFDFSKWEMLYQCRAVTSLMSRENAIDTLLNCARAARRSSEFHPASRFLRQGFKLERTPQQTLSLKSEQCKLEWASGERRVALRLIDTLLQECTVDSPQYPEMLITKADWLTETNTEFPSYIMENCLEEAVTWCQEHSDTTTLGSAHLQLALFADEQLKQHDQYFASTEYQEELKVLEKTVSDLEVLKQSRGAKQPLNKKQWISYNQQVSQDRSKMEKRRLERLEYLLTTVRNYVCSLKLNSSSLENDLLVFRLCSLLLDNTGSEELCELAKEEIPQIPTFKLLPPVYQLAARLGGAGQLDGLLQDLVTSAASDHPYHVLPILFALKNAQLDCSYIKGSEPAPTESRTKIAKAILKNLAREPELKAIVSDMDKVTDAYVEWANYNLKDDKAFMAKHMSGKPHKIPESMKISRLKDINSFPLFTHDISVQSNGNYSASFPSIVGIKSETFSPGGINMPKVTYILCSDGITRKQLVKGNDDLRQDMVMEQVFDVANQLLSKNQISRNLHMRTYKVLPLSQRSGILEWCENTQPLGTYLVGKPGSVDGAHTRYRPHDPKSSHVRSALRACYDKNQSRLPEEYKRQCKKFKPVFRHYFTEHFTNPTHWYKQKCNYTNSLATSSIVGHIVGLGDRHVQNILIDMETSELIHIDLGVAFDQGQLLHIPEKVPFRLTRDLVDGLGITGTEGVFRMSCEHVMTVLKSNKELLSAVIEVFIHDPLFNWCINDTTTETTQTKRKNSVSSNSNDSSDDSNSQAQRVLGSLKKKLEGIEEGVVLGVEGQINYLIRKAQDPANLSRIFVGWQAWV